MNTKSIHRRKTGAAIVSGVATLALITAITVFTVVLLLNAVTAYYYKSKLSAIGTQTVMYAVQRLCWNGSVSPNAASAASETREVTDRLLQAVGLPKTSKFDMQLVSEKELRVQFEVTGMTLPARGNMPSFISLTQTNTVNPNRFGPMAVFTIATPQGSVRLPAWGLYIPFVTDRFNGKEFHGLERSGEAPMHNFVFAYPSFWTPG